MEKTLLFFDYENGNTWRKVTAEKVDEFVETKENIYRDKNGQHYIVRRNKIRGMVFVKTEWNYETQTR